MCNGPDGLGGNGGGAGAAGGEPFDAGRGVGARDRRWRVGRSGQKKGRAAICAGAYNAYAMHADFVVGAAFKSRRDRLMETFGIDRQELSRLRPLSRASAGAMMGMPQN